MAPNDRPTLAELTAPDVAVQLPGGAALEGFRDDEDPSAVLWLLWLPGADDPVMLEPVDDEPG